MKKTKQNKKKSKVLTWIILAELFTLEGTPVKKGKKSKKIDGMKATKTFVDEYRPILWSEITPMAHIPEEVLARMNNEPIGKIVESKVTPDGVEVVVQLDKKDEDIDKAVEFLQSADGVSAFLTMQKLNNKKKGKRMETDKERRQSGRSVILTNDNQYMSIDELNEALKNNRDKNELRNRIMKRWAERDQEPFEMAKRVAEEYHRHVADVKKMMDIQCADGNWNYDAYMMGMANGVIAVYSVLTGADPVFLSAPKVWLKDLPKTDNAPVVAKENDTSKKENENDQSE